MAKVIAVVALAVVAMVVLPIGTKALTCVDVSIDLTPCLNFIRSGGEVPPECCGGLNTLVKDGNTTDNRRAACNCLKTWAQHASQDELNRANSLPNICKVPVPIEISPSVDCSKIN